MYIGKHTGDGKDPLVKEQAALHIPENYAGTAFVAKKECEQEEDAMPPKEPCIECACSASNRGDCHALSHMDRLFSTDTLLIFLAILLFGSEGGEELSLILLLLLLF